MAAKNLVSPIVLTSNDEERPQKIARKTEEIRTEIHHLPYLILEQILLRIPAKTVFSCKIVSKPWLSIVDDPIFARSHFSRAPVCPLLVFSDKSGSRHGRKFTRIMHLIEGQTVSDLDPSRLSSRIEFSNAVIPSGDVVTSELIITGILMPVYYNTMSCEGIVCWASYGCLGGDIISFCNPITGEQFAFYPPNMELCTEYSFIGLGFCRATKKFELLTMSRTKAKDKSEVSPWWAEVLTVGDTYWRRVEVDTFQLNFSRIVSEVVYVNGAIYWRYYGDSSICCFNFDMDIFQLIPLPQMTTNLSLGVLANCLCASLVSPDDGHVALWVLLGIIEVAWMKLCNVESEMTNLKHIGTLGSRGEYKVIKYLDTGEILMHDWRETFLIYDPITGREKQLRVSENSRINKELRTHLHLQVVPHDLMYHALSNSRMFYVSEKLRGSQLINSQERS